MAASPSGDELEALRASLERALGDRYRIVRLLGRGGMGAVYLAREESLDRLVAIKVLRTGTARNEEAQERFRREARVAAGLSHGNIVPLHAFGESEGLLYLVMGFVSGESLGERLKREPRLPEADARRILADVAEALDYAHRNLVVHRDVKPDNILLEDETGRAFLADFGIAKGLDGGEELTQAGQLIGTPLYMSPEQAAGRAVDSRSDLYSLGAVAFAMLAGRPPFSAKGLQESILQRHTQPAPSLAAYAPDAPPDLVAAVDRCLAREPDQRFKDARAFRQAVAPDPLVEDDLPEPLDLLDGKAVLLLVLSLALGLTVIRILASKGSDGRWLLIALVGLVGALVMQTALLLSATRMAFARGFSWPEVARALFRQPRGWLCFFYPPRFRRKDDVFDRLPGPFRAFRIIVTLFVIDFAWQLFDLALLDLGGSTRSVSLPSAAGPVSSSPMVASIFEGVRRSLSLASTAYIPISLVAAPVTVLLGSRLLRKQIADGYARERASRALLLGPTSDKRPWRRPEMARVLAPAAAGFRPESPQAMAAAIVLVSRDLEGEARRVASDAGKVAQRLLDAIGDLDREIARRRVEFRTDDKQALAARIRSLEAEVGGQDEQRRELRRLLEGQLGLIERAEARVVAAEASKARVTGTMRSLWSAAARLGSSQDRLAVDRLRDLVVALEADESGSGVGSTTSTSATLGRESDV